MMKMLLQMSEALPPLKEVVHDVPNSDQENYCITVNHLKLDYEIQQEFGTKNHEDELDMANGVSYPIDIEVDVATNVEVEVTTNMKLELYLNKSVEESIHFLAQIKEVKEFILFSFDEGGKT
ncbi:hypothetical protein J1N35_024330 [Gossypium stocksii]|uniref:Uncharacterized protein n=1 Tax=Gossypium stocksii TaxID=47602 RepID=A0A9D3ZW62_9ROSI|nr:hypothetical protein J1N35_024330 [Gossypium stocksii]